MNEEQNLYLSMRFKDHPIIAEDKYYKQQYVDALNYITKIYSKEKTYTTSLINKYSEFLLSISNYNELSNSEANVKKVCKYKFKNFKIFTYRYCFIYDCLLINAFDNPAKALEIISQFKNILGKLSYSKIDELHEILYKDKESNDKFKIEDKLIKQWKINKEFIQKDISKIVVTATMSAGKSTLINSIIGKKLALTKNEACTGDVYLYYNKPFEDNLISNQNKESIINYITYNPDNLPSGSELKTCTYMNILNKDKKRICLIDTPGINSYLNIKHKEITEDVINSNDYNKLIYVINATNIGAKDDINYINQIYNTVKGKQIIFVLNKIDLFRLSEDSIEESINKLKEDLKSIGFDKPIVCPVSAYAGLLFKIILVGDKLNEDEELECEILLKKFSKSKYDLSKYYESRVEINNIKVNNSINFKNYNSTQVIECMVRTGIISLEELVFGGGN